MTIVQAALQKAKDVAKTHAPKADDTATYHVSRTPPRIDPSTIDPAARIRLHRLSVDPELCAQNRLLFPGSWDDNPAAVAAYRILRTRVLHRARQNHWVTIGITSANPNDGKTLTAVNLSLSLAREKNSEVVLLDLDMRNPSVYRTLGVQPPRQLRDYFEKGVDPQELFGSIGVENLIVAGNTVPSDNASELLASSRFEDLVSFVKTGTVNPVVLIDLPPVLATDDALVIAPRVDAILIVASEGNTGRTNLERAINLLSEFRIAGVVLNRSTESSKEYGYGYGSNYGKS
jgi:protein-tyrosine kinase